MENLKVGDIIVDRDGDKVKVLAVLGDVFLRSDIDVYNRANCWLTKQEAIENGWKLDTPAEEMTVEEICKELGRTVKIIK